MPDMSNKGEIIMKVIGLTGGIASGKTLIAEWFIENNVVLLDSDKIYKQLLKTNEILYNKITDYFGQKFETENGELNLSELGKYVFSHHDELEKLNEIAHPFVLQVLEEKILSYQKQNKDLIVLDIPLLYEAKLEYICDEIICVYVDYETQIERLQKRDSIDREFAIKKISAQMDLKEKAELSDYVIDNSENIESTKKQFVLTLEKIRSEINVI